LIGNYDLTPLLEEVLILSLIGTYDLIHLLEQFLYLFLMGIYDLTSPSAPSREAFIYLFDRKV